MNIEYIQRSRFTHLVLPIDFIEPPRYKIHTRVSAFIIVVRAIPVKPPAATHRAEAKRLGVPAFEGSRFGYVSIAKFVVDGGIGMDIAMRSAPNVHLVVHVVEMRCGADALASVAVHWLRYTLPGGSFVPG